MSKLFVVGTPIGNLDDISGRALEVFSNVDLILAEDTRVIQKILNNFEIKTSVSRYNEHKPEKVFEKITELFKQGKSVALVSDAGMPGVSDPGGKLVEYIQKNIKGVGILVVPGPSAVTSALAVPGMPANEFTFLGYPPAKNKRQKFFKKVAGVEITPVVLYESPHRFLKTLRQLKEYIDSERDVFVGREMTKMYEEYFRGTVEEALYYFGEEGEGKVKGEFVIVIE